MNKPEVDLPPGKPLVRFNVNICMNNQRKQLIASENKDKDKDSFIGQQEFVVGYSKAPEQMQSSARPICHSHTMTSMGREPATIAHCATHCAMEDDDTLVLYAQA